MQFWLSLHHGNTQSWASPHLQPPPPFIAFPSLAFTPLILFFMPHLSFLHLSPFPSRYLSFIITARTRWTEKMHAGSQLERGARHCCYPLCLKRKTEYFNSKWQSQKAPCIHFSDIDLNKWCLMILIMCVLNSSASSSKLLQNIHAEKCGKRSEITNLQYFTAGIFSTVLGLSHIWGHVTCSLSMCFTKDWQFFI